MTNELIAADAWHRGTCTYTIGPRGGVTVRVEEWRRNGATQTWKTRPNEFRVPIKYGMRDYWAIDQNNAHEFHRAGDCVPTVRGNVDAAPEWVREMVTR